MSLPPEDRLEVRILTLADHAAAINEDGKLYINGAGVGTAFLPQIPGPLVPISLVLRVRIPWNLTTEQLALRVRVLDADRNPVGPDPLLQGNFEVGRPPGVRAGDEIALNLAFSLAGFPVQSEGTIYFHVLIADQELGVLPLKIVRRVVAQMPAPRQA